MAQANAHDFSPMELYLRYALAGAQCCMLTHTVLVPIDVVKTRLQTERGVYRGMFHAFSDISKKEGPRALFLGLTPTAVGYSLQGACKFGFYEFFKEHVAGWVGKENAARWQLPIYLGSAATAEVIGTAVLCPWEALRIKKVSQPDYCRGILDGLIKIGRTEGMNGYYKGLIPILGKQVPYTMTQLTVFQFTVDYIYNTLLPSLSHGQLHKHDLSTTSQLSVSLFSGIIAGLASAVTSHPADTLLSRVNMTRKEQHHQTSSSNMVILRKAMQELGFRGLWLGLGTRCFMVGLLSAGMFLIYDSVKVMCGLPTTSGISDGGKHHKQKEEEERGFALPEVPLPVPHASLSDVNDGDSDTSSRS
ncbi:mitochondrial phosphate carrier protein [Balamuthia mandrillaris]